MRVLVHCPGCLAVLVWLSCRWVGLVLPWLSTWQVPRPLSSGVNGRVLCALCQQLADMHFLGLPEPMGVHLCSPGCLAEWCYVMCSLEEVGGLMCWSGCLADGLLRGCPSCITGRCHVLYVLRLVGGSFVNRVP